LTVSAPETTTKTAGKLDAYDGLARFLVVGSSRFHPLDYWDSCNPDSVNWGIIFPGIFKKRRDLLPIWNDPSIHASSSYCGCGQYHDCPFADERRVTCRTEGTLDSTPMAGWEIGADPLIGNE
jgi:hypothetical protein